MFSMPTAAEPLISTFSIAFTRPTFQRARVLGVGAILAMGRRTVANVLWTVRSIAQGHFSSYHRVFSRGSWSLWPLGKVWVSAVLQWIPEDRPVLVVGDDTVAQHRGAKVYGKAQHRDAVRSSHSLNRLEVGPQVGGPDDRGALSLHFALRGVAGAVRVVSWPAGEPGRRAASQDAGAVGAPTDGGADPLVSPKKIRLSGRWGLWVARIGAFLLSSSPARHADPPLSSRGQPVRSTAPAQGWRRPPADQGPETARTTADRGPAPTWQTGDGQLVWRSHATRGSDQRYRYVERARAWCRCAGCRCTISTVRIATTGSTVPIPHGPRHRWSACSRAAGPSRRPFKKCVPIWASKPHANVSAGRYCAPPHACWGCSASYA